MELKAKTVLLKNGKEAVFRSPAVSDAANMLAYLKRRAGETHFLMAYPEELENETVEREEAFLERKAASETDLMILCEVEGKLAGTCEITFYKRMKVRHRATVAIGILKEYWDLGMGTAMFAEMEEQARQRGVTQMELEVIEGNERAIALYKKRGFVIAGEHPNAIRLKDGTLLCEYFMVKSL